MQKTRGRSADVDRLHDVALREADVLRHHDRVQHDAYLDMLVVNEDHRIVNSPEIKQNKHETAYAFQRKSAKIAIEILKQ